MNPLYLVIAERMMHQRIEEEMRQAEHHRLVRLARKSRQGRLSPWRTRLLCQLSDLIALVYQSLKLARPAPAACAD